MDFINRIGTVRHKFKVQFFIGQLSSNANIKGQLSVLIKRGDHKQATQQELQLNQKRKCDFKNEILTFNPVTMFYQQSEKKYQQKQGQIRVLLLTSKKEKKILGKIHFDLAKYANDSKQEFKQKNKLQDTADKLNITLQYRVYIKNMGQASQTSKSMKDKQLKKQNSLSKFSNFIGGIFSTKDEQSEKNTDRKSDQENQNQKKKKIIKPVVVVEEPKPTTPPKKKRIKKTPVEDQEENPTRTNPHHTFQIKKDQSDDDFQENLNKINKKQPELKNKVKVIKPNKQKNTLTDYEQASPQKDSEKFNQNFYFDEPQLNNRGKQFTKKLQRAEEPSNKNNIKEKVNKKQQIQQNSPTEEKSKVIFKQNTEQLAKLNNNIQQFQKQKGQWIVQKINLQKQNQKLKKQNSKVKEQIIKLTEKINEINQNKQRQTIVQTIVPNYELQQKIKNLEKQKSQYLVNMQKIKQQYKKQLQACQQKTAKFHEDKSNEGEQAKAQLKRLKDMASTYRATIDDLYKQQNQNKVKVDKLIDENNKLTEFYGGMEMKLRNLKLKLAAKLNEANSNGEQNIVNLLTELNLD